MGKQWRAAGWLLLSATCVAAQEATVATSSSAFPLPQITVNARSGSAPASVVVREVSAADIDAYAAHNVGEALTPVPGVNVQIGGSSGDARAWIRGFRDRDSLVLFDGIPIASGFEGTIDLKEIATDHVGSIEVIKSAPSVIYGVNGMGGVIDIQPRYGHHASPLRAEAVAGENGRRRLQIGSGGGSRNLGYLFSVSHDEADDYRLADGFDAVANQPASDRVNSDFRRDTLFFRLDAANTPIGRTAFFYNLSDGDKGLAPDAGVDDPDFERLTESRRQTVGLSATPDNMPLAAKLYYNSYRSDLSIYTDETYAVIDELERGEDYSYGAKLYYTLDTHPNNTLVFHAATQNDVFKAEGELEHGNKAEIATWTLAAEDQFWLTDRLSLALGGIYTVFDQTLLSRSSTAFSPQLALGWQANDHLALHASAARRTRLPKLRELYRRRWGNPALSEQSADNFELGAVYRHGARLTSDIALFYSDVDGLIERPTRRSQYENFAPLQIKGVEASAAGWLSGDFYTRVSYTFVDAAESLPGGAQRQLRSRPRHTAQVELRYRFGWDIVGAFNGVFVAGLHDLDADGAHTELDSFFIATLKATRRINDKLSAYVAASNIFDKEYLHRLGDPREGRALRLGLKFEY